MNPVTTTFVRGFGRSGSHSPLYSGVRAGETTCADICRPCADLCNPKIHPSRTMKGMSECGWLSRREMPSLSLFCGFVLSFSLRAPSTAQGASLQVLPEGPPATLRHRRGGYVNAEMSRKTVTQQTN